MKRDFVASTYIIHEEKILFVHHKKLKKWVVPGGHLDLNELPHECAIREALEETGLTVRLLPTMPIEIDNPTVKTIPQPFLIALEDVPECNNVPAHQHIDFIYACEVISGELQENASETAGIQWLSLEEIHQLAESGETFIEIPKIASSILEQYAIR